MAFSDNAMTAIKPGATVTIYAVRCKRNGFRYVGATGNTLGRRWPSGHRPALKAGVHGTQRLQEAWNRFGESNFVVEVLEEGVSYKRAAAREAHWIAQFKRVFNTGDPLDLATHSQKRYVVTDPSGHEFEIINLNRFCRERGLTNPNMVEVARCRKPSHRGWLCRLASTPKSEWEAGQARLKAERKKNSKLYKGGYHVTDPDGRVLYVEAITPWANSRGLDAGALIKVARGEARHHHGFKARYAEIGGTKPDGILR